MDPLGRARLQQNASDLVGLTFAEWWGGERRWFLGQIRSAARRVRLDDESGARIEELVATVRYSEGAVEENVLELDGFETDV